MTSLPDGHAYRILLHEGDPQDPQPSHILVSLKPHQRAALAKARVMETDGCVRYHVPDPGQHFKYQRRETATFRGQFTVQCNIGILGDMVGYGKTLTALAVIAHVPVAHIHVRTHDFFSYGRMVHSHFMVTAERWIDPMSASDLFQIHTTLVVVPRGPVYGQWEKAIRKDTSLHALFLDSLPSLRKQMPSPHANFAELKQFLEQYDLVLIKNTTLATLLEYQTCLREAGDLCAWDRIMVDEAHDILATLPMFRFQFLWLITATYRTLLQKGVTGRYTLSHAIRDVLIEERMNLLLLCGEEAFVKRSFVVPPVQTFSYLCAIDQRLAAVHPFLQASLQDRINANDIRGAIRDLGGHDETETDIVKLVTQELERDILNKGREVDYVMTLDISEHTRGARLEVLQKEQQRLSDRLSSLRERVTTLSEKMCNICMETLRHPVILPCAHIYCGGCMLQWMRSGHVCPDCRTPILCRRLIAIVRPSEDPDDIMSKEDTLLKIIREKPEGRFLVFSKQDRSFHLLKERLDVLRIPHALLKGTTHTMNAILERFQRGELRVILLNTQYAGSGIDISCATDVILFHTLGWDGVQAVGRAQRVGRTTELQVHQLYYPNELIEAPGQAVVV